MSRAGRNAATPARVGPGVQHGSARRGLALAVLLLAACASDPAASTVEGRAAPGPSGEAPSQCPTEPIPATRAPDIDPLHEDVATWLEKLPPGAADEVLVTPVRAEELTSSFATIEGAWRDPLGDEIADPERVMAHEHERLDWLQTQVATGTYVEGVRGALASAAAIVDASAPVDEARVVVAEAPLFCTALASGLYKPPIDRAFDRNRCASLHPGEVVRVVRRDPSGEWLGVHAGHTSGWLHAPSLTPPQPIDELRAAWNGRRIFTTADDARTDGGHRIRLGTQLPVTGETEDGALKVLVATPGGLSPDTVRLRPGLHDGPLPLTRRALWTAVLGQLGAPYGWGGRDGNRDCSRLVRDLFVAFGLQLPRHSGVQAEVGTRHVDVSGLPPAEKIAAIDEQASKGIVLLYMPGHVMIHLGADGTHRYAVSAISEYLTPCPGGPDTVHRLDRVAVSTLEVGRGTERTAFIERLTRLIVFAPPEVTATATPPE